MLYRLENLQRRHGQRTVLNISRLEIKARRIYTLIGPNGAGKTSLLKILAFLDRQTSGRLFFQDNEVREGEKHLFQLRRKVVLLDQNPIMFTGSVYDNVAFGLKVRQVSKRERAERIDAALDQVGMSRFANYEARGLSGGETKRVALARALVLGPEVLLFDEPTANVDIENQEIILKIIEKIKRKRETSVIFSTHYLSQGRRLADHTLLLQHGALSDVVNDNVYRVAVVKETAGILTCQLTGQLYLTLPAEIFPADVTVARLHIDPEQIVFEPRDGSEGLGAGNKMAGHVVEIAQQEGRVRMVIDVGVKMAVVITMAHYRGDKPQLGNKVHLFIPHSAVGCTLLS